MMSYGRGSTSSAENTANRHFKLACLRARLVQLEPPKVASRGQLKRKARRHRFPSGPSTKSMMYLFRRDHG